MSYLNSVTIIRFVGADPEQRQARNNGSKFTVLSVATQRSWKNAEDEWVSKVEWHRVAIIWNLRERQPAGSPKCRSNIIQDTLEAAPLFSDPHRRPALTGRLARSSSILRRECRREYGKGIGIGWVNKSLLKV